MAFVHVDLDSFETDEIIDHLKHLGYLVTHETGKGIEKLNSTMGIPIHELDTAEVLAELRQKYGKQLPEFLRQLL